MLPKRKRLTKEQFELIFSSGKKKYTEHFMYMRVPSDESRFAVVVSKKIDKKAISRNRKRRQIYNLLTTSVVSNIQKPYDTIIVLKKPFLNKEEITEELQKILLARSLK